MPTNIIKQLTIVKVKSECIDKLAFVSDTKDCFVKFQDGTVYVDRNMDPGVFRAWLNAPSVGKFFQKYVRKTHEFSRIEGDKLTFEL